MSDFKYFTRAEFKKLTATIRRNKTIEARRDLNWISIMRYTGIRLCVMRQFTLEDAQNCIAKGRFIARAETNKGGVRKDLTVRKSKAVDMLLTEKVKEALIDLIDMRREYKAIHSSPELILSRIGKGLSARSYQDRLDQWKTIAGLKHCEGVSVHGLRHTYAMMWLESSSNVLGSELKALRQLSKNMNHSSINSTLIYLDALSKDQVELCEQAAAL
jgi:integrase